MASALGITEVSSRSLEDISKDGEADCEGQFNEWCEEDIKAGDEELDEVTDEEGKECDSEKGKEDIEEGNEIGDTEVCNEETKDDFKEDNVKDSELGDGEEKGIEVGKEECGDDVVEGIDKCLGIKIGDEVCILVANGEGKEDTEIGNKEGTEDTEVCNE